jgi:hypothetical protein
VRERGKGGVVARRKRIHRLTKAPHRAGREQRKQRAQRAKRAKRTWGQARAAGAGTGGGAAGSNAPPQPRYTADNDTEGTPKTHMKL